jgi:hypothetical protein
MGPSARRGLDCPTRFPAISEPSAIGATGGSPYPRWSMLWFMDLLTGSLVRWPCRANGLMRQQHRQLFAFIRTQFLANDLRSRLAHRASIQNGEGRTKDQEQHDQGSAQPSLSQPFHEQLNLLWTILILRVGGEEGEGFGWGAFHRRGRSLRYCCSSVESLKAEVHTGLQSTNPEPTLRL